MPDTTVADRFAQLLAETLSHNMDMTVTREGTRLTVTWLEGPDAGAAVWMDVQKVHPLPGIDWTDMPTVIDFAAGMVRGQITVTDAVAYTARAVEEAQALNGLWADLAWRNSIPPGDTYAPSRDNLMTFLITRVREQRSEALA